MKLHNSVVLLTGASQGISRALARQLDQQGCRLLLVAATGGFASTAVLALAIDVLGRIDPALLPGDARAPDYLADAAMSAQQKSAVLQHAMAVGGAPPAQRGGRLCPPGHTADL